MTMGPFGKTSMKLIWVYLTINHINIKSKNENVVLVIIL